MLTKRRILWPLAIVVVAYLQLWSCRWSQHRHIPTYSQFTPTRRFQNWAEWRFRVIHCDVVENLARNSSTPRRAKEMINDILSIGYDTPLGELRLFHSEVQDRFDGPVSCETLEWLWTRAAALSPRAASYTTKYRLWYEYGVLYQMDCPISTEGRRRIELQGGHKWENR